ncbi:hypothetical protein [Streptomyces sp. S816]|uniref:hypothetical protein n=1 Tax=Streptomyces sp. S816 TaxID=2283197 RepID=UPI00144AA016|nr:hypothetical protein [Streptomyces sp. S816]
MRVNDTRGQQNPVSEIVITYNRDKFKGTISRPEPQSEITQEVGRNGIERGHFRTSTCGTEARFKGFFAHRSTVATDRSSHGSFSGQEDVRSDRSESLISSARLIFGAREAREGPSLWAS